MVNNLRRLEYLYCRRWQWSTWRVRWWSQRYPWSSLS